MRWREEKEIRRADAVRRGGLNSGRLESRNQIGLGSLWKITTKVACGEKKAVEENKVRDVRIQGRKQVET